MQRHHRHVAGYAVATLMAAIALWAAAYAVAVWLTLFLVTVIQSDNAPLPVGFRTCFVTIALGLLAVAWLDHRANPDKRPRDSKSGLEIAFDFILAIPRVTLAVWGNLSAWQTLQGRELEQAIGLVEGVEARRRLPVQAVPQYLMDEETRDRILFTLQLIQVLEMRREDGEAFLFPTGGFVEERGRLGGGA